LSLPPPPHLPLPAPNPPTHPSESPNGTSSFPLEPDLGPHGSPRRALEALVTVGPGPSTLPYTQICPHPVPAPRASPQLLPATSSSTCPESGTLPPPQSWRPARCPRPREVQGRDPRPRPRKQARRPAVLTRTGRVPRRRPQSSSRGAGIAPRSSPQQPPPLLRTHNKQCGARAASANCLNRRLNRRPPGTARRAGAGPAAAYPRRRAPPASAPRSRSAAAATSSARVSGSSAQRRRLRRLLPWWRSRIRARLRQRPRRRRQARDAAEHAHWPIQGAGPAAAGERKARPIALRAPPARALCRT
jgi:hypothetical protein